MKSEKQIKDKIKFWKKVLKSTLADKDYSNVSDIHQIIIWLEWVLSNKKD